MAWMTELGAGIDMRIVPEESLSIIGSSDKNTKGELYTIDIRFNITQPIHRRNKRLFDMAICVFMLALVPIALLLSKNKRAYLKNLGSVFLGNKTWVAYAHHTSFDETRLSKNLPKLKQGIFSPLNAANLTKPNAPTIHRLNFLYAKDYDIWRDAEIIWHSLGKF
jgi:hypothetical protein